MGCWRNPQCGSKDSPRHRPAGERVVLCGRNSPELAAAYFAVHAAGGVTVLLDADIPAKAALDRGEHRGPLGPLHRELDLPLPVANLAAWCGRG